MVQSGNTKYGVRYLETKLTPSTAQLARGCGVVAAFVSDIKIANVSDTLYELDRAVVNCRPNSRKRCF